MLHFARLSIAAALVIGLTGCPAPADPATDGGTTVADGGVTPTEPTTLAIDDLSIASGTNEEGDGGSAYRVNNRFADACDVIELGDCRYELCRQGSTEERRPDYGVVRFVTDTVDERFEPLSTNGIYGLRDLPEDAGWTAGPITISGAGGSLPAFSETFDAPAPLSLVAPAVGSTVGLVRGDSLEVRWSGGAEGTEAVLRLRSSVEVVRCAVPAERGSLLVPAAAISRLIPEGGIGPVSLLGGLGARTGAELDIAEGRVLRLNASTSGGGFVAIAEEGL